MRYPTSECGASERASRASTAARRSSSMVPILVLPMVAAWWPRAPRDRPWWAWVKSGRLRRVAPCTALPLTALPLTARRSIALPPTRHRAAARRGWWRSQTAAASQRVKRASSISSQPEPSTPPPTSGEKACRNGRLRSPCRTSPPRSARADSSPSPRRSFRGQATAIPRKKRESRVRPLTTQ